MDGLRREGKFHSIDYPPTCGNRCISRQPFGLQMQTPTSLQVYLLRIVTEIRIDKINSIRNAIRVCQCHRSLSKKPQQLANDRHLAFTDNRKQL